MEITDIQWSLKTFAELSPLELFEILHLRQQVFIVEQKSPYEDIEELDKLALHFFATLEDQLAAYMRICPPGLLYEEPSFGRFLVSPEQRGSGLGQELLSRGLQEIERLYPNESVRISAQTYLEKFYSSVGFRVQGEAYEEVGVLHVDMLRPVTANE